MGTANQSWLWPEEQIVYWARQRCRQALMLALVAGAGAVIVGAAFEFFDHDTAPGTMLAGTVLAGCTAVVPQFFTSYRRLELVLTSQRIFYRSGLFWRQMGEFAVADITDIEGTKTGDYPCVLKLAGGKSLYIHGLPDLGRLRETLAKAAGLS